MSKDFRDLIKLSYGDDNDAKKLIDEGKYKLSTADAIIFPHLWEMVYGSLGNVTVTLESQRPPKIHSTSDHDEVVKKGNSLLEGENVTLYKKKIKYTISYYRRTWTDVDFLDSKTYDDPVVLERGQKNLREVPVLEEKRRVTFPVKSDSRDDDNKIKRKQKLDQGDAVGTPTLHIRSPFLLNALRSIIKYTSKAPSGDETEELRGGEFQYPYADLFYHKQELRDYKDQVTGVRAVHTPEYNAVCDSHIDVLLEYLDQEPAVQLQSLEAKWSKKVPTTTFAGLWLLLKPGSDVYVREDGQLNAYVVDGVKGGPDYELQSRSIFKAQNYFIRVWNLCHFGKNLSRASKTVEVPVFDNEKDIISLPLFPTRFQDEIDHGNQRKQLFERGKKVVRYSERPAFLEYTGYGLKPGWKEVS